MKEALDALDGSWARAGLDLASTPDRTGVVITNVGPSEVEFGIGPGKKLPEGMMPTTQIQMMQRAKFNERLLSFADFVKSTNPQIDRDKLREEWDRLKL